MHDRPINFNNRLSGLLLMRVVWLGVLLFALAFAGCVEEPAPDPVTPAPGEKYGAVLPGDDPLSAYTWNGTNLIYDELDPPTLTQGTAWTYARSGVWDLAKETTVVVAEADADGYLFAATSKDHLVNAAIWWVDYLGPRGLDLNLEHVEEPVMSWPLFDGKTWQTHGVAVSAVADLIETPIGTLPGYRIEGNDGDRFFRATFVPEVGYFTSYAYGMVDGDVYEAIELVSIGTATEAYWFERGPHFSYGTTPLPGSGGPNVTVDLFDMPAGYEEIVFVGLGTDGAAARAQALDPQQGTSWGFEDADGLWDWQVGRVAATPGSWVMNAQKGVDGWAYFEGVPLRWVAYDLSA